MIWYVLLLVALVALALAKSLLRRDSCRVADFSQYHKLDRVMNESEQALYINLQHVLGSNYVVLSKVRIEDFVEAIPGTSRYGARGRIKSRHVDFLVCDCATTKPLLAIELDGKSHQRQDRQDRDHFVDELYEAIGLPIEHIPVGSDFLAHANRLGETLKNMGITPVGAVSESAPQQAQSSPNA